MYKVALVNMPFAAADVPSIALAQLRSALLQELRGEVEVRIFHFNLDCCNWLGSHLYDVVANSVESSTAGLGDWFFSREAFPAMADSEDYLVRHFLEDSTRLDLFSRELGSLRPEAGAFLERLCNRHELDRFSLVGFTSMFSQNAAGFAMARKLKARNPSIVTVMGGANCETPMGGVIARNVAAIDYVFSGPALKNFPQLVRHLLAGETERCHAIPGVLSRHKMTAQALDSRPEVGEELDINIEVPLDYDDYFAEVDAQFPPGTIEPKLPFETSRGCWWGERSHCTFCGLNGMTMKYRALEPQRAVQVLNGLFERYADRAAEFRSVDNILPREYLTQVLPHLQVPEHVSIFYEIKADLKEREVEALAKARVTRIQPGIEALATSTLKLMRKGTTAFQNLKFLKYCQIYGITPYWNLLVGFPLEREDVYRKYCEDIGLLVHLHPPLGAFPVRFDRFSPYFTHAREYGLELRPHDFYRMIYPFAEEEIRELAYFFVDDNLEAQYITSTAKWLSRLRERISYWHRRWLQDDVGLKPELYLAERDGAEFVYDSRSGEVVEHALAPDGLRILNALSTQLSLSHLAEHLPDLGEAAIERQVGELRQRGLLFEEAGFYMTLLAEPGKAATTSPVVWAASDVDGFNAALD
jgi:magnesium-protoporphyrin IX monomethyl ester (oxidative) cyclase